MSVPKQRADAMRHLGLRDRRVNIALARFRRAGRWGRVPPDGRTPSNPRHDPFLALGAVLMIFISNVQTSGLDHLRD